MIVQEMKVTTVGGELFVKLWHADSKVNLAPLILLHDSLGCVDMWRSFPAKLARVLGRTVIAYDRLGFGQSTPRNKPPSLQFIAEEAELYFPSLLEALALPEFILFGHSVGGAMAVHIAARFPDRCAAIITESAQAFIEAKTLEGLRVAKEFFKTPEPLAKLGRYHGERAEWVLGAWTEVWLSPEFADWNIFQALAQTYCPLLAIHGDRDEYGSPRFPQAISERSKGPSQVWLVEDCGHVPHREKETAVIQMVQAFLATT